MLGEKHRLLDDFPEFSELIETLSKDNPSFSNDNQRYNQLDDEIRKLELGGAPIGDDEMHRMKQERSVLKDKLYQLLLQNKT